MKDLALGGYSQFAEFWEDVQRQDTNLEDVDVFVALSIEEWEQLSAQKWYADMKKRLYGEEDDLIIYWANGVPYQVEVILRFAR